MDTPVLQTIPFVPAKNSYLSIKLTGLLQTLVNTDNKHFSMSPVKNSDTFVNSVFQTVLKKQL